MLIIGNWWSFVLRGLFAVVFGLIAFFLPPLALVSLIFAFGFYAILDGVTNIVAAFRKSEPHQVPAWAHFIQGIFSIVAGLLAFFLPGITALALLFVIAGWAIVTGVMSIISAVRLRKQITGEWLLVLTGVLSVIFGVLVAIFPQGGALALTIWIGAYSFVNGIMLVVLGFQLHRWIRKLLPRDAAPGFPHVAPGH